MNRFHAFWHLNCDIYSILCKAVDEFDAIILMVENVFKYKEEMRQHIFIILEEDCLLKGLLF